MFRSRTVLAAVGVTAFVLVATAIHTQALHRNTPLLLQITEGASADLGDPRFAGRSNVLLFHSDQDLLGNGNSVSQIFVFDLATRVKKGELGLFQMTDGALASREPSAAKRGRVVVFESEGDLLSTGSTGLQLFASVKAKWKKNDVPLFAVTRGSGESFGAAVSDRGKFVAFSSTDDLLAEGLGAGTRLYRGDLRRLPKSTCPGYPCPADGNPGLVRVSEGEAEGVTVGKKGTKIAFISREDEAGTGCGTGTAQLFLWDEKAGTTSQITCGAADSRNPSFTRSFRGILFESDADLLGTSSGHTQIFHLDIQAVPPVLTQMTFGTDGDSRLPAPNGTGRKVRFFFMSTADLIGAGTSGVDNLFMYDAFTGISRLTNGTSILSTLTGQFLFAAFLSDDDLVGSGNSAPQLFLINQDLVPDSNATATPMPTPTPTLTPTPTATPTVVLERIELSPATRTMQLGELRSFLATGHYSDGGTQNLTQQLDYSSSAPAIAAALNTPGNKSQVEALTAGTATISAVDPVTGVSSSDTGDDAVVTVLGPLLSITLTPSTKTLNVGGFETFTATGHFDGGSTQNLTQQVVYSSSHPAVVSAPNTPGNRSRVDAVGVGIATISATHTATGIVSTTSGGDATVTVDP